MFPVHTYVKTCLNNEIYSIMTPISIGWLYFVLKVESSIFKDALSDTHPVTLPNSHIFTKLTVDLLNLKVSSRKLQKTFSHLPLEVWSHADSCCFSTQVLRSVSYPNTTKVNGTLFAVLPELNKTRSKPSIWLDHVWNAIGLLIWNDGYRKCGPAKKIRQHVLPETVFLLVGIFHRT